MFDKLLIQPLSYSLSVLAPQLGSYGLAIIVLTLIIKLVLVPLTLPSLKAASKLRDLQPEIDSLKKQYKNDKVGLQQAQLALFQKHQVNPASGCLPNILQFVILIALYQVIDRAIRPNQAADLTQFLWFNVTQPDPLFVLPVIAALTQLVLGLMLLPAVSTAAEQEIALETKSPKDDEKADDMTAMAQSMQQQMVFMMPAMTLFLALKFPAGLTMYWVVTTVFSIIQQYYVSGWGGLISSLEKAKTWINKKIK